MADIKGVDKPMDIKVFSTFPLPWLHDLEEFPSQINLKIFAV